MAGRSGLATVHLLGSPLATSLVEVVSASESVSLANARSPDLLAVTQGSPFGC